MLHQGELQAEAHQRRTEQHSGVDIVALARRPAQQRIAILGRVQRLTQFAPGKQQTDGHIHQEEQNQERLGAPQQLWLIGADAPGEADAEGADKADQVEQPPSLEPGNGKDPGIEQGEITEQRYMVATAGAGQDRRGETTQRRCSRKAQGILFDRQNRREHRHQH